jgi:hypothetical protein
MDQILKGCNDYSNNRRALASSLSSAAANRARGACTTIVQQPRRTLTQIRIALCKGGKTSPFCLPKWSE